MGVPFGQKEPNGTKNLEGEPDVAPHWSAEQTAIGGLRIMVSWVDTRGRTATYDARCQREFRGNRHCTLEGVQGAKGGEEGRATVR